MSSMVEAKMKPRRGNGTPHPRGRRPSMHVSQEEDNQSNHIQHDVPDQAEHAPSKSSLDNLLHIHTQVTHTLHQIDNMVLNIHKLASSNHLVPDEVQDFADALASVDANLQDWNDFLKTAAERSSLSCSNLEQEPCNTKSPESTPGHGVKSTETINLGPPISDLESGTISRSPLVAPDLLDCDSSCSSEPLTGTTTPDRASGTRSSTSLSPLPQTPRMLSPPRSIRVLSAVSESPSLSTPELSFYVNSDCHQIPKPQDLLTPESPTCQSHLVFETPPAQVTQHEELNDGRFLIPRTPGFGVSPPRTCRPLRPGEMVSTESDPTPSTPVMPSPFRTPGILLECESVTSESSSAASPAIIDDLTASMVKRLGPRGLEERLWQELSIRKADILLSVKHR